MFLLSGQKPGKFGNQYSGPFKIVEVITKNNLKIQTNKGPKMVHANRLRISHINHEVQKVSKIQDDNENT